MLILLCGQDTYRRNKEKNRLINGTIGKYSGLSLRYFSFEEGEKQDSAILDFLSSQSLFSPVSLAVIEGALSSETRKGFTKELASAAKGKNSHAILIEDKKPTAKTTALLGESIKIYEFEPLTGIAWQKFVKNEVVEAGLEIDADALVFLSKIHEGNSWWLSTELLRLRGLAGKTIKLSDLGSLHAEVAQDFWPMLTVLTRGRRSEKVAVLEKMLTKEPAGKIFNILAGQSIKNEPRFAVYDRLIKSGKIDYEEALVDFAIN